MVDMENEQLIQKYNQTMLALFSSEEIRVIKQVEFDNALFEQIQREDRRDELANIISTVSPTHNYWKRTNGKTEDAVIAAFYKLNFVPSTRNQVLSIASEIDSTLAMSSLDSAFNKLLKRGCLICLNSKALSVFRTYEVEKNRRLLEKKRRENGSN